MTTRQEFINFIYPINLEEIIRVNEEEIDLHKAPIPNLDSLEEINSLIERLEQEKDNNDLWAENRKTIHLPNVILRLKGRRQQLICNSEKAKQQRVEKRKEWGEVYPFKVLGINDLSVADIEEAIEGEIIKLGEEFDHFLNLDREHREEGKSYTGGGSRHYRENRKLRGKAIAGQIGYRRMTEWCREENLRFESLRGRAKKVVTDWKIGDWLLKDKDIDRLLTTLEKTKTLIKTIEEENFDRRQKLGYLFKTQTLPAIPNEPKEIIKKSYFEQLDTELGTKFKLAEFESKCKWKQKLTPQDIKEAKMIFKSAKKETLNKTKERYIYSLNNSIVSLFSSFLNSNEVFSQEEEQEIQELLAKEIQEWKEKQEQLLTTKSLPESPKKQSKIKKLGNKIKHEFKEVFKPKEQLSQVPNFSLLRTYLLVGLFTRK